MPLDIDSIYLTETMVQILREQGHNVQAMELAEKILAKDPENESVKKILEELKGEARQAFERFQKKGSGKDKESSDSPEPDRETSPTVVPLVPAEEDVPLESGEDLESESTDEPTRENGKHRLLKNLLKNVQDYRQTHDSKET